MLLAMMEAVIFVDFLNERCKGQALSCSPITPLLTSAKAHVECQLAPDHPPFCPALHLTVPCSILSIAK